MMREIKFKAYHSEYGKGSVISMSFYEKTREINSDTECYAYYPKMNVSLLTSYNDVELMQYTGLKDKNGAEIYEGDILRCDPDTANENVKVVEYVVSEYYGVGFTPLIDQYYDNGCLYSVYEVIGNIYENKELLKEINK